MDHFCERARARRARPALPGWVRAALPALPALELLPHAELEALFSSFGSGFRRKRLSLLNAKHCIECQTPLYTVQSVKRPSIHYIERQAP